MIVFSMRSQTVEVSGESRLHIVGWTEFMVRLRRNSQGFHAVVVHVRSSRFVIWQPRAVPLQVTE
jgi:hypothetical protein